MSANQERLAAVRRRQMVRRQAQTTNAAAAFDDIAFLMAELAEATARLTKATEYLVKEFSVDHTGHNPAHCMGGLSFVDREARDLYFILNPEES